MHGDPRDDFLALSAVRESLKGVAGAGIPFDVPNAWPRHLSAAVDLAEAIPELTVVIDHLGKPPLGTRNEASWRAQLTLCAALPNTVAKVSGMYGGDWPVSTLGGNYVGTLAVLQELIGTLDSTEAVNIKSGTARRTYGHAIWDQGGTAQPGT